MHQIVEDEGKYNFGYQITPIILSAIISTFFLRIFLLLIITEKDILSIKKMPNKKLALNQKEKTMKCLKIKYLIFFLLNIILLILFWFYLTCLNALYQNTQLHIIKNTFISFGISLFYPFIINILPGFLRIYSLKNNTSNNTKPKKNNESYNYKVSQIIQLF